MSLYKSHQFVDSQVRCKKFIGDLFGSNVTAADNPNFAKAPMGYAPSDADLAANRAQQQQFVTALQAQANGTGGPSAAQAMLQNSTQANDASAHALQASQQGNVNQGLATRNAMQQSAQNNQQAAGQGAVMRQNEMLSAQQQLGGQLNTMYGQGAQGQQANNASNLQAQNINANIATGNAANNGQIAGATIGAIGQAAGGAAKMLGMAEGGVIPPMQVLGPAGGTRSMGSNPYTAGVAAATSKPTQGKAGGPKSQAGIALSEDPHEAASHYDPAADDTTAANAMSSDPSQPAFAKGGKVPALVSPGEGYLRPKEVKKVAEGKENPIKAAEKIPGKPKVAGAVNSYANDTVPKKLDAGGVILPRSVMMSEDPAKNAAKFVAAVMAKQGRRLK